MILVNQHKGGAFVKRRLLLVTLICVMIFPAVVFAADSEGLFVQKCGSCHLRGGEAAPVNPGDKAGVVWAKYFKRDRHPVDLSQNISDDEMDVVLDYLEDHAADSAKPQQAAIPK